MIFSLEALPAKHGDCLLLHYGTAAQPRVALIDGGPGGVYRETLKPRLEQLRQHTDPFPLELVMVSHVDQDHILGILDLTHDLIQAEDDQVAPSVTVDVLWHNSFDDVRGNRPEELEASFAAGFGAASVGGEVPDDSDADPDVFKVLASIRQGRLLRKDAIRLGWTINSPRDVAAADSIDRLFVATGPAVPIEEFEGLKFHLVGPMKAEVEALQNKHDAFLRAEQIGTESAEASFELSRDTSAANLSSLVFLVEKDDRRLLLTGDARGDKILEGLELAELVLPDGILPLDLLKVPHHGSDRNVPPGFFARLPAEHYVASGDGFHGNPERGTFELLFAERPDAEFTIHLTYPVDEIDVEREKDWTKAFDKNPPRRPRPWDPALDSLGALFEEQRQAGHPFRLEIGSAAAPVRVDLGAAPAVL